MSTLEELEKATQTELDAIAVSHQRLEAIAKERDRLLALQQAADGEYREKMAVGGAIAVQVPAAKFKPTVN